MFPLLKYQYFDTLKMDFQHHDNLMLAIRI